MKVSRWMTGAALLSALLLSACAFSGGNDPLPEAPQTSSEKRTETVSTDAPESKLASAVSTPKEESPASSPEESPALPESKAEETTVSSEESSEAPSEPEKTPSEASVSSAAPLPEKKPAVSSEEEAPADEGEVLEVFEVAMVDVADAGVQAEYLFAGGKDHAAFLIRSAEQLRQFANDYREICSLDAVDSGVTFEEAASQKDEAFFQDNFLVITVEKYRKSDSVELFDLRSGSSGVVVDMYKNLPENEAQTGYMLFLASGSSDKLKVEAVSERVFPAEGYVGEEEDEEEDIMILD